MGLSVKDAKRITEAELGPFNEIPASFLDIGINDGFKLFNKLKKYVDKLKKDNVPVMKRLRWSRTSLKNSLSTSTGRQESKSSINHSSEDDGGCEGCSWIEGEEECGAANA